VGMFNSIVADLLCPATGKMSMHSEIQIKWEIHEARTLQAYYAGDLLAHLEPQYDNTWIRTDYICNACSPKTADRNGHEYIRTKDQRWHLAFVEIDHSRISRILTERQFKDLEVHEFVDDVWAGHPDRGSADPAQR